jgi:hypothetical protein
MSLPIPSTPPSGNPVFAARRAAWSNLRKEALERPALSVLVGLLGLASGVLVLGVLHELASEHAGSVLGWLRRWAPAAWGGVFLLCLAGQVPPARRDLAEAESGWLAALPQMPRAMEVWSRWRGLGLALLQATVLLAALLGLHRLAPEEAGSVALDGLLALVIPMLAWLLVPPLARSRHPPSADRRPLPRGRVRHVAGEPGSVLAHWQRAAYRRRRWTAGVRWSLGALVLLLPAGASFLQVGAALQVGVLLLQWQQFWSSSLGVVVRASALTAALPRRAGPFVRELSALPALLVLALLLFAFALLVVTGLSAPSALLVSLALSGALVLHAATVMAWRHRPRLMGLRSAAVLLAWIMLSQTAPFMAPLIWLGLFAWLLRRALKEAS